MKDFLLLISPYETNTCKWEMLEFDSLEEASNEQQIRDLTKEWYIVKTSGLIEMVRREFENGN